MNIPPKIRNSSGFLSLTVIVSYIVFLLTYFISRHKQFKTILFSFTNREIKRLTTELKEEKGWHERLALAYDDAYKEKERFKRELRKERQSHEGKTFEVTDLKRENQRLREKNRRLKHVIQTYENTTFQ